MKVIGLTGGIGSGKSTVSAYLKEKGCPVVDADRIARTVTAQGSPVLAQLACEFGSDILFADGSLDRKKLGRIVFSDPRKKSRLDAITLGEVCDRIRGELERVKAESTAELVVLDVPLLFETGLDELADSVWVVDADDETRIKRICDRDHMSREEAENRMARQMPREERLLRADHVLDNSGDRSGLFAQVAGLMGELK